MNSGTPVSAKPAAAASVKPSSNSCACHTNGPPATAGSGQPQNRKAPQAAISPQPESIASANIGLNGHSHKGCASCQKRAEKRAGRAPWESSAEETFGEAAGIVAKKQQSKKPASAAGAITNPRAITRALSGGGLFCRAFKRYFIQCPSRPDETTPSKTVGSMGRRLAAAAVSAMAISSCGLSETK